MNSVCFYFKLSHLLTYLLTYLPCIYLLAGIVAHYEVPMDVTSGNAILNPTELDVTLTGGGSMTLVPGINRKAVQFDGLSGHIAVANSGFGFDCFGDFDKCTAGERKFTAWK